MKPAKLSKGMKFEHRRRIGAEDVRAFTKVSEDAGAHHVREDERGRLLAHGLLVASLVTKLGGDLDYLARTMYFEFKKPAYSGDELTCVVTVDSVIEQSSRVKCSFSFVIVNQDGEVLMTGESAGMIRK